MEQARAHLAKMAEKRSREIVRLRAKGLSFAKIADRIGGITRQRVQQIHKEATG
jgi:DNA-directed RNA polymerase specialized sigma subunit